MGVLRRKDRRLLRRLRLRLVCPEIGVGTSNEHDLPRDQGAWCVRLVGGVVAARRASRGLGRLMFAAGTVYMSIESPPLAKLKFCCCCWALAAPKPK